MDRLVEKKVFYARVCIIIALPKAGIESEATGGLLQNAGSDLTRIGKELVQPWKHMASMLGLQEPAAPW